MSDQKIRYLEELSKSFNEEMEKTVKQICEEVIPDSFQEEDIEEIEKQIKDELNIEFSKGYFKVEFGKWSSMKPPSAFYYRFECQYDLDGEITDLQISYDP